DVPPASLVVTRAVETVRWTAAAPGWRFWCFHFTCLGSLDAPVNRPLPIVEHRRDDEDFLAVVAGLSSPNLVYRQWASATFAGMFWRWMIGWTGRWNVPANHRVVARVVERVYQRIGEDWSIARLAREEGISERYLNQLFRNVVGESPKRFLNRMRLLTAEQMLRFGRMNVKQVALQMGFATPSHFTNCFRALFGETPKDYLARVHATRCGIQRDSS
ncbi:MAG: helix-turn-helix transcriptional regulator, partial [Fimbriimonadaceae bacterium]